MKLSFKIILLILLLLGLAFIFVVRDKVSLESIQYEGSFNTEEKIDNDLAYLDGLDDSTVLVELKKIIDEKGSEYGFALVRAMETTEKYENVGATDFHSAGHYIGEKLYEEEGFLGLDKCTAEFTYGCYHTLLAKAIYEAGGVNIKDVYEACEAIDKEEKDCAHGIGHALVALSDYEILEPLSVCTKIFDSNLEPRTQCGAGALMEYNLLTMEGPGDEIYRDFETRDDYYPCSLVDNDYKESCYKYLSRWWFAKYGMKNHIQVAELCSHIAEEEHEVKCYEYAAERLIDPVGIVTNGALDVCQNFPNEQGKKVCEEMIAAAME